MNVKNQQQRPDQKQKNDSTCEKRVPNSLSFNPNFPTFGKRVNSHYLAKFGQESLA